MEWNRNFFLLITLVPFTLMCLTDNTVLMTYLAFATMGGFGGGIIGGLTEDPCITAFMAIIGSLSGVGILACL